MIVVKDTFLGLFQCRRFNTKLTINGCLRYQENGQCVGCEQINESGRPMVEGRMELACKTCGITGKKLSNGRCLSCAGKSRREEEKKRKGLVMKKEKEDIQPDDHGHMVMLDFSNYPNLLEQVKAKAKEEFRNPEQQLMAWAWELCGNNHRPKVTA